MDDAISDPATEDEKVVEQILQLYSSKSDITYEDLVNHTKWYWRGGTNEGAPKEWVIDIINLLTGEYSYEDFCIRRGTGRGASSSVAVVWDKKMTQMAQGEIAKR